ncbi:MAG: hypothetical protein NZ750_10830 [Anaerolineae bacterium]|nr:hypothetical protein [Anaerolineae bacterium]MDW8171557.1 hypothetical protein [Anaerolineae bacterium]
MVNPRDWRKSDLRYTALVWLIRLFKSLAWVFVAVTILAVILYLRPLFWATDVEFVYESNPILLMLTNVGFAISLGGGMALISYAIGLVLDIVMDIAHNIDRVANVKTELLRAQLQAISQARTPRLTDQGQAESHEVFSPQDTTAHLRE